MITETYRTLYRIMNDNMQAASEQTLPYDEQTGEAVLGQRGEPVDVSAFAALDLERYMQAAYCALFYRPVDGMTLDAARALLQSRSERQAKKKMLRKILCAQAFEECSLRVRGLPRGDALSISVWRMVYRAYFAVERGLPSIRRIKDAVKARVRY